jgi:hypothetical protein
MLLSLTIVNYRLKAYDRNSDFKGTPVILPDPLSPHWPIAGFKPLRPEHKILLPKVTLDQVEAYFLYRMANDREACNDIKAMEKGKEMFKGHMILACSYHQQAENIFFSGIVGAAMRHKLKSDCD